MNDALTDSWLLVFWCMCWIIVLYVIDELCLERFEVARKYTETLEGWRDIEVVDWLTTMRFEPDVISAFKGMDGKQMHDLTKDEVDKKLSNDKKREAADLWKKLQKLKHYNPHHGHGHGHGGHGGHGDDHGDAHGHGGHDGGHDHETHSGGHGHGADVEMQT